MTLTPNSLEARLEWFREVGYQVLGWSPLNRQLGTTLVVLNSKLTAGTVQLVVQSNGDYQRREV